MVTWIILAAVILIAVYTVVSYRKKLTSGCCGAQGDGMEKKVRVEDRNKNHYPYQAVVTIDGMVCGSCSRRVENALNRLDGVWAQVDLGAGTALVRMKYPVEDAVLKEAVNRSGYTALRITHPTGPGSQPLL